MLRTFENVGFCRWTVEAKGCAEKRLKVSIIMLFFVFILPSNVSRLMWDIFLLGGAEEMCSQLEIWLDSPDRVNKVTRRVRNDYKWPQISNIHRAANRSWNVWSTPQLSDLSPGPALTICWSLSQTQAAPTPWPLGGGCQQSGLAPCTLHRCHKPDLWLVTQGSGRGPWTCLCHQANFASHPRQQIFVTGSLGSVTIFINIIHAIPRHFFRNLLMGWILVWPRVTQLGHRRVVTDQWPQE